VEVGPQGPGPALPGPIAELVEPGGRSVEALLGAGGIAREEGHPGLVLADPGAGVCSDGSYGVPEGLISSFPVRVRDGRWEIVQGLEIDAYSRAKIDASVAELESWFRPNEDLMLTINLSHINSEYTDYKFNFVSPIAGYSQMAGNSTPRQPEWSGNATATQYLNIGEFSGYVRGEMIYQGKAFADEIQAKVPLLP